MNLTLTLKIATRTAYLVDQYCQTHIQALIIVNTQTEEYGTAARGSRSTIEADCLQ